MCMLCTHIASVNLRRSVSTKKRLKYETEILVAVNSKHMDCADVTPFTLLGV
jgi:hypothetical protein